jgi:hypothetical protein
MKGRKMLKIEIKSTDIAQRPFVYKNGQRAGQNGIIYTQEAWAHTYGQDGKLQPYPQRITLNIDAEHEQKPWPVGSYQLAMSSFYVGRFGDLVLGRIQLQPVVAEVGGSTKKVA